ncbi:MAG: DUF6502 family protein [Pseudobdellovibrionaceae bacterium]
MTEPDKALIEALHSILRPLARLLIHRGVTLRTIIDIIKDTYVEESLKNSNGGKPMTDSQISVMTGLHRKDVKAIRERQKLGRTAPSATLSMGAQIIAKWLGDKSFRAPDGTPRPLPYAKTDKPQGVSFTKLVESISLDVRPRTILDELLRLNIASIDSDTKIVTLLTKAFVPQNKWEDQVYYLGENFGDHLAASVHNVMGIKPAFFDRSVYYNGLTEESEGKLRKMAADQAMKTLEALNKKAYELSQSDALKKDAHYRFNFGSYYFAETGTDDGKKSVKE